MYSYIARRLAFGVLTVIGVSIMVFVIMRILPGDPLIAIFGPDGFTKLTDAQRANYGDVLSPHGPDFRFGNSAGRHFIRPYDASQPKRPNGRY